MSTCFIDNNQFNQYRKRIESIEGAKAIKWSFPIYNAYLMFIFTKNNGVLASTGIVDYSSLVSPLLPFFRTILGLAGKADACCWRLDFGP